MKINNHPIHIIHRAGIAVHPARPAHLCDWPIPALDPTGALVDGGQIGVHVAGETTSARHFLTGCRHLSW